MQSKPGKWYKKKIIKFVQTTCSYGIYVLELVGFKSCQAGSWLPGSWYEWKNITLPAICILYICTSKRGTLKQFCVMLHVADLSNRFSILPKNKKPQIHCKSICISLFPSPFPMVVDLICFLTSVLFDSVRTMITSSKSMKRKPEGHFTYSQR